MGHEDKLLDKPRGVAVDDCVFFGMKAATVSRFRAIASVVQSRGITVVANGQNLSKVGARNHGAHLKA